MNRVVKILMERDGISEEEANSNINNFRNSCMCEIEAGNINAPFDMIIEDLGLEPDYLDDILL